MNKSGKKKAFNILRDESAVSPMIATIMLIAVVAVLGAVIAASSMKSVGDIDTSNIAATLIAKQTGPSDYSITMLHSGGDKLLTNRLTYSVTRGENSAPVFDKMVFGTNNDPSNFTNYTITSPTSDPTYFFAGNIIRVGAVTDGILDNGTAKPNDGINTGFNRSAVGNTYHVVIRYDNKKVLLDNNVEIS